MDDTDRSAAPPDHAGQRLDACVPSRDGDGCMLSWSVALLKRMHHCSCQCDTYTVSIDVDACLARAGIRPHGSGKRWVVESATRWIEQHADDELLSVDQLASALNMSRASLHRKLVASIGLPPGELIRLVRLQMARTLLHAGDCNVSDVAYAVGFVSLSGFSRAYRHHFGEPPSSIRGASCAFRGTGRASATPG